MRKDWRSFQNKRDWAQDILTAALLLIALIIVLTR